MPSTSRMRNFSRSLSILALFIFVLYRLIIESQTFSQFLKHSINISHANDSVFLVTGVAGYIGSHMALKLLKDGAHVVGIDNMLRGSQQMLGVLQKFPNFEFKKLDMIDTNSLDALFKKHKEIDTVFHFTCVAFPTESMENDLLYKRNVLQITTGLVDSMLRHNVETLIHSSSCAVYGSPEVDIPVTDISPTIPISPYGKYKLEAEEYIRTKVKEAKKDNGRSRAHLRRDFNVIGADSNGSLMESPRPIDARYARLWTACLAVTWAFIPTAIYLIIVIT